MNKLSVEEYRKKKQALLEEAQKLVDPLIEQIEEVAAAVKELAGDGIDVSRIGSKAAELAAIAGGNSAKSAESAVRRRGGRVKLSDRDSDSLVKQALKGSSGLSLGEIEKKASEAWTEKMADGKHYTVRKAHLEKSLAKLCGEPTEDGVSKIYKLK